jgi:hypothetical protein
MSVQYRSAFLIIFCVFFGVARPAGAYSVLTHEQLIDLTWQTSIVPLLKSRYPSLTPEQIEHARAYAYGGCVIQDIGYYPFGDAFFSNLTHYVRSGDFVVNLFRNAGNADELAFAIGALSHYIGDSVGHATATNLAVPVEFPKLEARYGSHVTYAEGEHQHVQTEFAFDINEIAHQHLAPIAYLRHVGLQVPTRQLALAFYQTYGIRDDFTDTRRHRINVGGYRFAVHHFIPRIAYAVNLLHRHDEPADPTNDPEFQRLTREIAAVAQQSNWNHYRHHAGIGTYALAGLIYIIPKVGSLKLAAVKGPTAATDAEYVHSVLASTDELDFALRRFTPPPATLSTAKQAAASDKHSDPAPSAKPLQENIHAYQLIPRQTNDQTNDTQHPLPNRDLDTGQPTQPAGYRLTDDTYAALLHRIALAPAQLVPPGIKREILAYYADLNLNFATKKDPDAWLTVQKDLATLQAIPTNSDPLPYPTYGDGSGSPPPDAGPPASVSVSSTPPMS